MKSARVRQAGFTLVETLMALALLSLLMAYAAGSLLLMARTRAIGHDLSLKSDLEAFRRHLHVTLGDARAVFEVQQSESPKPKILFKGEKNAVEFVSLLSDHLERGGLYVLRYELNPEGSVVLKYRVFRQSGSPADEKNEALLEGMNNLTFWYFGSRGKPGSVAQWYDNWNGESHHPLAVQIEIATRGRGAIVDTVVLSR